MSDRPHPLRAGWLAVCATLAAGALVTTGPVTAQSHWSWPEKAENLKVLPADTPPEQLRSVMVGFTRSLGVRCAYCHVGEEGKPLDTYDFASDKNPTKETAREMLRMLGSIDEHMAKVDTMGREKVNVWCHTCHAGRPIPATLQEEMNAAYTTGGAKAAAERYHELHERYYGRGAYDFGERPLNEVGYGLLGKGDAAGAIAIFRLNAEAHPDSANVYDSLAEGYLAAGQQELAAIFYRKSLELDPGNENALKKLAEMEEMEDAAEEGMDDGMAKPQ